METWPAFGTYKQTRPAETTAEERGPKRSRLVHEFGSTPEEAAVKDGTAGKHSQGGKLQFPQFAAEGDGGEDSPKEEGAQEEEGWTQARAGRDRSAAGGRGGSLEGGRNGGD